MAEKKGIFLQTMNWTEKRTVKVAILDLNEGQANQGMRCLRELVHQWGEVNDFNIDLQEFEVRLNKEIPDISFDIYLSSGGPGSPLDSEGSEWELLFKNWIVNLQQWNENEDNAVKKHVLFICHSFQIASKHYGVGTVCKRKSTSFGVFPIHLVEDGKEEVVFNELQDPFYAVDSRDYQLIEPNHKRIADMGGKILAIEKARPHIPLERAVMALRFNDYFIGTQFHPEADPVGMSMYLQREDKKKTVIQNHGEEKWKSMIEHLNDPDKIVFTHSQIVPNFLNIAIGQMVEQ